MTDTWFSPDAARLFSYLSLLSLCSLFAVPARRGKLRSVSLGAWNAALGLAALLLAAGAFAAASGQPTHVSRALLMTGFVLGTVFALTRRRLVGSYEEAELRRTVATDL